MSLTYEEALEACKNGVNITLPTWPTGQYITWNTDVSEFHPAPSIDFVDQAGDQMSFVPADFDELADDWVEYTA
ncbi:MW1434 family type I TA system toxin [Klebsiella pneumoniae]|uniref:Thoeris anti-defense Tad2 family protein n=1 Tax=Klebsiella pneumoniae TaxID=573 RepID=UPI0032169169